MSKKRKNSNKKNTKFRGTGNSVFHMNSTEATLAKMPYIDGYVCRGGIHGDVKYNRRKSKDELRRMLDEEC